MFGRVTRILIFGVALALLAPMAASGVELNFFHSPGDDGGFDSEDPALFGPGTHTINLWADPRGAPGGGIYWALDVLIQAAGSISILSFACEDRCIADVTADPTREALFSWGENINNDPISEVFEVFEVATILIEVAAGPGTLDVLGGTSLPATLFPDDIAVPDPIAVAVPEPGTALMLMLGLGGLAYRRRADAA